MTLRPSVLLVDDEPLIRIALRDALEEASLEVSAASTGAEARALMAGRAFDVAVIDLRLPDSSGIDLPGLRSRLQSEGKWRDGP